MPSNSATRPRGRHRPLPLLVALVMLVGMVLAGAPKSAASADELGDGDSFAYSLMKSMAQGAASTAGSDLFGWVLGSAGSAGQDAAVLDQISSELDTIESTLVGIENEIAELINAIDQLDCDTWVQTAEPMVGAISNLWDPNSASAGGPGAVPQQSYVGIVAETQDNTITVDEMQTWVDQVLNNDGQGIGGLSVLDYLQDLGNVLISPAGGSGLIASCLGVPSNGPSNFKGKTDDQYYNSVVAPLIQYYYAIQTQGMTMVAEALNFEAWQAAGSPQSDADTINDLPTQICGDPTGQVAQDCENADWVVLGTNGTSGVRGRVAAQVTLGGAPYTSPPNSTTQPVHRYVTSKTLWASSPEKFTSWNSFACSTMDSNNPCGILSGIYSDTTVGGYYSVYGEGYRGTWTAASGPQLAEMFSGGGMGKYTTIGDYLEGERGFVDLPQNTIFITDEVTTVYPYSAQGGTVNSDVITFTDTGLSTANFPPYFGPADPGNYFNYYKSLQVVYANNGECDFYDTNPLLPPASANKNFYGGSAEMCGLNLGQWQSGPPGWTTDVSAADRHPQFHLPVIDVTTLACNAGLQPTNPGGAYTMCGPDFAAWLDTQVPPAPTTTAARTSKKTTLTMRGHGGRKYGKAKKGPLGYDRVKIRKGDEPFGRGKQFPYAEGDPPTPGDLPGTVDPIQFPPGSGPIGG